MTSYVEQHEQVRRVTKKPLVKASLQVSMPDWPHFISHRLSSPVQTGSLES